MTAYKAKIKIKDNKIFLVDYNDETNEKDISNQTMLEVSSPFTDTSRGYFVYDISKEIQENITLVKDGYYTVELSVEEHRIRILS